MPMAGGMVFDARPYVPDGMDRQRERKAHPLGDVSKAVRPPWLDTPPGSSPAGPSIEESAAVLAAGRPLVLSNSPPRRAPDPPRPPPPPQSAPSAGRSGLPITPPSVEDLFALYRLCGGSESRVVELLAKLWDTQPAAIASVVKGWMSGLPDAPPPSRRRTAPPELPSWLAGNRGDETRALSPGRQLPLPRLYSPLLSARSRAFASNPTV